MSKTHLFKLSIIILSSLPTTLFALTQRISVDDFGNESNSYSSYPQMTPDGMYVTFQSYGDTLVPNDTNGQQDIFIKNTQTNGISRLSVDENGVESNGYSYFNSKRIISADGRYVMFQSYGSNLVSGDTNGYDDVFIRDVLNNTTTRISVDGSGNEANSHSYGMDMSLDGRYVLFQSQANNLVPNDTNGEQDIFVRDMINNTTTRITVDSSGNESNGNSYISTSSTAISQDGRFVTFMSYADNLVANDTNGQRDVFVRDVVNNTTMRVSVDASGNDGDNYSEAGGISADGRYVIFSSSSSNLVTGDTNGQYDIFVRDIVNNMTTRISVDSSGNGGDGNSYTPIHTTGMQYILFASDASNLVVNDTNLQSDIFLRDVINNTTTRISVNSNGDEGNGNSYPVSITPDGKYVLFQSQANNLVWNDTNGEYDTYIRDILNNRTYIVSVDIGGNEGNDFSEGRDISDSGDIVLFFSPSSNLVPNDTNGNYDIFINDRRNILPQAPVIMYPAEGQSINTGNILLQGNAFDNTQVDVIYLGSIYTTLSSSTGAWSVLFTGLTDGVYSFSAIQFASGFISSATGYVNFLIDQTAPQQPTITYPINNSTLSGYSVTVNGTGEVGSYISVTIGNTTLQTVVDGNGDWSAGMFMLLPNNQYSANVVAHDDANNTTNPVYSVFTLSSTVTTGYTADLYLNKTGLSDNDNNGFDSGDSTTNTATGKNIRYNLTINNIGSGVATGVYVYETIPQNTCFTLGSTTSIGTSISVAYSNNGGLSYNYVPTPNQTNQDCNITNVRFELINPMSPRHSFYNVDTDIGRQNLYGSINNIGGLYIDTNTTYSTTNMTDYAGVFTNKVIDYNKDGCDDIFTLGYTTGSQLYTNNCIGGFNTSYLGGGGYDGAILDDFNNDGFDDVIGVGRAGNSTYYMNLSGTGFLAIDIGYYGSIGGSSADFDNDGFKDIMISGWPTYGDYVLHNNGGTGFVLTQSWAGRNALNGASADFNKDGWIDSVSVSWVGPTVVYYENTGTGALYLKDDTLGTGLEFGQTFGGTVLGDFNHDTWPDFVAIGRQQESFMFLNNTTGGFIRVPLNDWTFNAYYRGVTYDFNHDGWDDFTTVTYQWSNASIYFNNKDNTFTRRNLSWEGVDSYGISDVDIGDFNRDGVADMAWAGRAASSRIAYGSQIRTGYYNFMLYATGNVVAWNALEVQQTTIPGDNKIEYTIYPFTDTGCQFDTGAILIGPSETNNGSISMASVPASYKSLCVRANFEIISGSVSPVLNSIFATWNTADTSYIGFDLKVLPQVSLVNTISNTASIMSSSPENNYTNNQDTYVLQLPPRVVGGGFGGGIGGNGGNGGGHSGGPIITPPIVKDPITTIDTTKPDKPTVIVLPPESVKIVQVKPTTPNLAIKDAIVQTSYVSVGSTVEVKTVSNPALGSEKKCYTPKEVVDITLGKNTTNKDQLVYQALLKSYDLTMFSDTDTYMPENGLKRYEAAKMFTNFAKHVLCREATAVYANSYTDIEGIDETLRPYIIQAYEYGILKGSKNEFRPLERISRKEFVAALMRMFTNENMDIQGKGNDWDTNYQAAFKSYGLESIVGVDEEINRYAMSKIMYKLYYNTTYEWTEKGYVLPYGRD